MPVRHLFDILVLEIQGDRPEHQVGGGHHIEKFFVDIQYGHTASAAGGAPVDGQF